MPKSWVSNGVMSVVSGARVMPNDYTEELDMPGSRLSLMLPWFVVLLGAVLYSAWLAVFGIVSLTASPMPAFFADRTAVACTLLAAFAAVELLPHAFVGSWVLPPAFATVVNLVLVHSALALYATCVQDAASSLLLYLGLALILILGSLARYWRHKSHGLQDEVQELRTQTLSLTVMLNNKVHAIGGDADSDSDESEFGDDREHLIAPPPPVPIPAAEIGIPEKALTTGLAGKTFKHDLAMRIALNIRKKRYDLAHFYGDCLEAFPELQLYLAATEQQAAEGAASETALRGVTSGLTSDEEYRRTIGAMFAVYWLMRIGIDGERGFSFGVDEDWVPHEAADIEKLRDDEHSDDKVRGDAKKRLDFIKVMDWGKLQELLADAGMMTIEKDGSVQVHGERTLAMLALTAFHDIMKVQSLLPVVAAKNAPFCSFKEGDMINDHDIALGYVLTHHTDLLPSFNSVTEHSQKSIRFTQSKMQFNHGWLVQGEAPPSPLFANFKEVLISEHVAPADVAFYFTHWFTDLAGAEPSPLGGAEKFVLKFPHAVLDSFIRSFAVLNELAIKTETQVMEEYLCRTWAEAHPEKLVPRGEDSVAIMRLSLQAQTPDKQAAIVDAWSHLSFTDRTMLTDEMSRSGIEGQVFDRGPRFKEVFGPTLLVYYSPAFVRTLAPANALDSLRVLAEVYRRARELWPLRPTVGNGHSVTVRIDQLRELKTKDILKAYKQGECWIMTRKNDIEGVVEKLDLTAVAELGAQGVPNATLKLWSLEKVDKAGGSDGLSKHSSAKNSVGTGSVSSKNSAGSYKGKRSKGGKKASFVTPAEEAAAAAVAAVAVAGVVPEKNTELVVENIDDSSVPPSGRQSPLVEAGPAEAPGAAPGAAPAAAPEAAPAAALPPAAD